MGLLTPSSLLWCGIGGGWRAVAGPAGPLGGLWVPLLGSTGLSGSAPTPSLWAPALAVPHACSLSQALSGVLVTWLLPIRVTTEHLTWSGVLLYSSLMKSMNLLRSADWLVLISLKEPRVASGCWHGQTALRGRGCVSARLPHHPSSAGSSSTHGLFGD